MAALHGALLRDLRGHVRRDEHDALGAVIRQIFTAPDADGARRRLRDAVEELERRLPKIAALLEQAEAGVLAFYAFPVEHWPEIRSTNPLERFNREIARRTDVVGIFPDDGSLIRLSRCWRSRPMTSGSLGAATSARRRWPL